MFPLKLTVLAVAVLSGVGCVCAPPVVATCSPKTCANGCCSRTGECVTTGGTSACGLNGASCSLCSDGMSCTSGLCVGQSTMDAGADAGTDAGVDPCAIAAYDPVFGTLRFDADAGYSLHSSRAMPVDLVRLAAFQGGYYGLFSDFTLRPLGPWDALDAGAPLATLARPEDLDAGLSTLFLTDGLASNSFQLATGYTKAGAGAPGTVVVFDDNTQTLSFTDAPGNYALANGSYFGATQQFVVSGLGLGTADAGAGLYRVESQPYRFANLPSGAASGPMTFINNGGLLAGYSRYPTNHIVALTRDTTQRTGPNDAPVELSAQPEVFAADDLMELGHVISWDETYVVRGGFTPEFKPYTRAVELWRVNVFQGADGGDDFTKSLVATPLASSDTCTRVVFATQGAGLPQTYFALILGVEDKHGRRLVRLTKP